VNPEVHSVAEFSSIREGIETSPCRPFLVYGAAEFHDTPFEEALARFRASRGEVFGYDDSGDYVEHLVLGTLTEEWLEDRLRVKVLDSPLPIVDLPSVLDAFAIPPPQAYRGQGIHQSGAVPQARQSPVLTRADAYTPFHLDPPLFGGGWTYLWRGTKKWQFVSQEWIPMLFHRESPDRILDASPAELANLDPRIKCWSATAGPGDFLYFPPGWIHRVWTQEKALGVGGYLLLEGAWSEAEQASRHLDALGEDYWGQE